MLIRKNTATVENRLEIKVELNFAIPRPFPAFVLRGLFGLYVGFSQKQFTTNKANMIKCIKCLSVFELPDSRKTFWTRTIGFRATKIFIILLAEGRVVKNFSLTLNLEIPVSLNHCNNMRFSFGVGALARPYMNARHLLKEQNNRNTRSTAYSTRTNRKRGKLIVALSRKTIMYVQTFGNFQ